MRRIGIPGFLMSMVRYTRLYLSLRFSEFGLRQLSRPFFLVGFDSPSRFLSSCVGAFLVLAPLTLFGASGAHSAVVLSPEATERFKTAMKDYESVLGSLLPWQKRIYQEEVLPQSQRFMRGYEMSEEKGERLPADVDDERIRAYLAFYGPRVLEQQPPGSKPASEPLARLGESGPGSQESAAFRVVVFMDPDNGCHLCMSSARSMKQLVVSRLARRGMTPLWISKEEVSLASAGLEEEVRNSHLAASDGKVVKKALAELVLKNQAHGYLWISWTERRLLTSAMGTLSSAGSAPSAEARLGNPLYEMEVSFSFPSPSSASGPALESVSRQFRFSDLQERFVSVEARLLNEVFVEAGTLLSLRSPSSISPSKSGEASLRSGLGGKTLAGKDTSLLFFVSGVQSYAQAKRLKQSLIEQMSPWAVVSEKILQPGEVGFLVKAPVSEAILKDKIQQVKFDSAQDSELQTRVEEENNGEQGVDGTQ